MDEIKEKIKERKTEKDKEVMEAKVARTNQRIAEIELMQSQNSSMPLYVRHSGMRKPCSVDVSASLTERDDSKSRGGKRSSLGVMKINSEMSTNTIAMSRKSTIGSTNMRSSVLPNDRTHQVRQLMQILKLR